MALNPTIQPFTNQSIYDPKTGKFVNQDMYTGAKNSVFNPITQSWEDVPIGSYKISTPAPNTPPPALNQYTGVSGYSLGLPPTTPTGRLLGNANVVQPPYTGVSGYSQATTAQRAPTQPTPPAQPNLPPIVKPSQGGNQPMADTGTGGFMPTPQMTPEQIRAERYPGIPYLTPPTQQIPPASSNKIAQYTDSGTSGGIKTGGVNTHNTDLINSGGTIPGGTIPGGTIQGGEAQGGFGASGELGQYSDLYGMFGNLLNSIKSSNELYQSQLGGLQGNMENRLGTYDQQMQQDRAALMNLLTPEHMQMLIQQQMTNLDPQYQQGLADIQQQLPEALVRQRTMDERRGFGASTEASKASAGIEGDAIRAGSDLYNALLGQATGNASNFLNQQLSGQGQLAGLSAAQYGAGMDNYSALSGMFGNMFGANDMTTQRQQGVYGDQAGLIEANQNNNYRNAQLRMQEQQMASNERMANLEYNLKNKQYDSEADALAAENEYNVIAMSQSAMDQIGTILDGDAPDADKQRQIDAIIGMYENMYGGSVSNNLRSMFADSVAGSGTSEEAIYQRNLDTGTGIINESVPGMPDWLTKWLAPSIGDARSRTENMTEEEKKQWLIKNY